jgi:hypothetical protein
VPSRTSGNPRPAEKPRQKVEKAIAFCLTSERQILFPFAAGQAGPAHSRRVPPDNRQQPKPLAKDIVTYSGGPSKWGPLKGEKLPGSAPAGRLLGAPEEPTEFPAQYIERSKILCPLVGYRAGYCRILIRWYFAVE